MSTDERYLQDFLQYQAMAPDENIEMARPIYDEETPLDPWYFYQDCWAFARVLEHQPEWMLDIGARALLVGVLATMLPLVEVEIRPLPIRLPQLTQIQGSITDLPFEDNSVPFISCLSVIEHIGLGRYGDELDPEGSEKACGELMRVLQPGGRLLLSMPVNDEAVTVFNLHRLLRAATMYVWAEEGGCKYESSMTISSPNMTVWCSEWIKA